MKIFQNRNGDLAESGFALVSVLWIIGLLGLLAFAFTLSVRSHIFLGRNIVQGQRAEVIADGMTRMWALKLAGADAGAFQQSEFSHDCRWFDRATVAISVQDEAGLVDLNTASPNLMQALLEGVGFSSSSAEQAIRDMQDYKDPDKASLNGGVEPDAYEGRSHGPKNGPFAVPEELDQSVQIAPEKLAELLRYTTVYSGQVGIDLDRAPPSLLQLLRISDMASPMAIGFASPSSSRTFRIEAAVAMQDGSRYVRKAIISLQPSIDRPFVILAWQRGSWREEFDTRPAIAKAPCIN